MKDAIGREIDYLRVSVTDLCNLRCRYCMKEEGIPLKKHNEMMSFEDMLQVIKVATDLGIHKVRITGGEPLVKKGVISFLKEITKIEGVHELCLTTNGTLLKQYIQELKETKVNRINISLDTLNKEKYTYITRGGHLQDVLDGLDLAIKYFEKVKINVVYMQGFNDDEVDDFINLTKKYPIDVRFIELMPIGEAKEYPQYYANLQTIFDKHIELKPLHIHDGVSRLYDLPNALGKVGVINAMSHSFCSSCNRLRLTADGKIKPCLFAREEYDLKHLNEKEMKDIITKVILHKPKSKENHLQTLRDMNEIGG